MINDPSRKCTDVGHILLQRDMLQGYPTVGKLVNILNVFFMEKASAIELYLGIMPIQDLFEPY